MLPDYPDVKHEVMNALLVIFRDMVRERSVALAGVSGERHFEGDRHGIVAPADPSQGQPYQELETTLSLSTAELQDMRLPQLLERLTDWAEDMAAQQSRMLYNKISETTERTGNVIQADGVFTAETLLAALDTVDVDFDPDGTPRFPTLHIHPSQHDQLLEANREVEDNPELQIRWEDLVAKKREQWRSREARRKLVG